MFDKIILALLGCLCALFLFSLIQRKPHADDAWLGELAWWQAKAGYAKSELMRGVTRQEWRHVAHHKLLTLQGALAIRLGGFRLPVLKMVGLLYFVAFLWLFYRQLLGLFSEKWILYATFFLFGVNALVFEYAFVFRPEMPVMTLGFVSFLLLEKNIQTPQRGAGLWAFGSGLAAGLCMSTHLNGAIFPFAGAVVLMYLRLWVPAMLFAVGALAGFLPYFYDLHNREDLLLWYYQLRESPSIRMSGKSGFPFGMIDRVLREHERFFHSPKEITFGLMWLAAIAFGFGRVFQKNAFVFYYFVLLAAGLAFVSVHKTSKYAIAYFPYLYIMLALSLKAWSDRRNGHKKWQWVVPFTTAVYVVTQLYYDVRLSFEKFSPLENRLVTRLYISERPDTCRIVAPLPFVFDELERYASIQADLCYSELQKKYPEISGEGFLEWTRHFGVHAIVLSKPEIRKLNMGALSAEKCEAAGYEVVCRTPEMMVLRKAD